MVKSHIESRQLKYFSLSPMTLNNLLPQNSFHFIINLPINCQLRKPSHVPKNTMVKISPSAIPILAHTKLKGISIRVPIRRRRFMGRLN